MAAPLGEPSIDNMIPKKKKKKITAYSALVFG